MGYPQVEHGEEGPAEKRSEAPASWTDSIRRGWDAVPEDRKRDLDRLLGLAPGTFRRWSGLMQSAAHNLRLSAGDRRRVAIVGPPNAGKSTLYNRLITGEEPRASVGPEPGTTRVAQEGDAGLFSIIDTPGADAGGGEGLDRAMEATLGADVVVAVFDATDPPDDASRELLHRLLRGGKGWVAALNKMDLIRSERPTHVGAAAGALGLQAEAIVPISARTGDGLERLLTEVARQEPEIVVSLGRALPAYRQTLAREAIRKSTSTAAAVALTPLPMLDFIPLIAVQTALVIGLARIYDYRITPSRARELLATFGVGLLGRTLFHELVKLGGPPGWLVAAGVAAGTTAALGYGANAWFAEGERMSQQRLRQVAQTVSRNLIDRLRRRRKPRRRDLEREVHILLEETGGPSVDEAQGEETRGL